jgi:MYXO-CTERM domain-containing protein
MHEFAPRTLALHQSPPRSRVTAALALTAALLAVAAQLPSRAHACSCMPQTPRDAFEGAVAVFEGHVAEVQPPPETDGTGQFTVRMKVVRAWKGIESEEAVVTTAANSATCGYNFAVGTSYLVYAGAIDGKLDVSLCSRTQPIAAAGEDLEALGLGATPVQPQAAPTEVKAEQQQGAPGEPPARGGCGCTSSASSTLATGLLPLCALLLVTSRRRSRSRS